MIAETNAPRAILPPGARGLVYLFRHHPPRNHLQEALGVLLALFRRQAEPHMGVDIVLDDSLAARIEHAEGELRLGMILRRRLLPPRRRPRGVRRDAFALVMHGAEGILRPRKAELGGGVIARLVGLHAFVEAGQRRRRQQQRCVQDDCRNASSHIRRSITCFRPKSLHIRRDTDCDGGAIGGRWSPWRAPIR